MSRRLTFLLLSCDNKVAVCQNIDTFVIDDKWNQERYDWIQHEFCCLESVSLLCPT